MNGAIALKRAKTYVDDTLKGSGAIKGQPGKDGENGKSAYEIAKDNGFTGTEQEWLDSLQGQPGDTGNGIASITKESSTGNTDTYRILFTDNTSTTFTVTNATTVENLSQLNNDVGFITNAVNNLVNYYTKVDVYSKDEIGTLLQNIGAGLSVMVVATLPTADISATTIYLVKDNADSNSYEQWMYIAGQWASLGSTTIDLSNYYTKPNIDNLLLGYVTTSTLLTVLADYVKKSELATVAISGSYNDLKDLPTIPVTEDLATKEYVDNAINNIPSSGGGSVDLSNYYTKAETYSKTEVDNLIPNVAGISPTVTENENNNDTTYKLDITDVNGTFTTTNLKGADGRSIVSIATDSDYNLIVTYSDGTTQNIGKVDVNIQGSFLSSEGIGDLRYHDNKFQVYISSSKTWVDVEPTADNPLVMNLSPQPMQKMVVNFDIDKNAYKITFKEPKDTIVNNQMLVAVEGIKFVRKLGSEPSSIEDGILVLEYKRRDFADYNQTYFHDTSFSATNGDNWFYKAFPYSTNGIIGNSSDNVANAVAKNYHLYGFKIDQNESDPASMITYIEDNKDFQSAYMDYTTDSFNYGDWENAFFMKVRPCMLKYDGTVGYYLNPDDYTKKEDGTASDVANVNYGGNAMIQFPKVYLKIVDNGDNTANIYISDKKLDNNYHCWSHIDNNGNEIPYCYMPIYNGYSDGTRLRSLSGKAPIQQKTAQQYINFAIANNIGGSKTWYIEVFCDRQLVNLLLLLIGKSTNTQAVFGNGHYTGGKDATSLINTGTMNKSGLFYGTNNTGKGVKVFGMEHWWGNQWRRIAGWINDRGTQKIKMTYGQSDGSTVNGYNTTGSGYLTMANAILSNTNAGYLSKMVFDKNGIIPKTATGSATTYYTDGLWANNANVQDAFVGGASNRNFLCGALASYLTLTSSHASWDVGAALSCKPLATS